MKISSEQAFDMLPYAVDIFEKLDLKGYRKKIKEKYKGKQKVDVDRIGIDSVIYIVKNSSKIKEEFFSIVAIAENKTVEQVKSQSPIETVKVFKEIFENNELMVFFKQAM